MTWAGHFSIYILFFPVLVEKSSFHLLRCQVVQLAIDCGCLQEVITALLAMTPFARVKLKEATLSSVPAMSHIWVFFWSENRHLEQLLAFLLFGQRGLDLRRGCVCRGFVCRRLVRGVRLGIISVGHQPIHGGIYVRPSGGFDGSLTVQTTTVLENAANPGLNSTFSRLFLHTLIPNLS